MTSNNPAENKSSSNGEMSHKEILVVLVGLMSGMFLAALDQSVVGAAMRTIADDLDGLALQAWATTAYLITSTVSTPIYGKLGDIFGRRPLFLTAIAIFIVGSLATGFANSMYELALFRALQGIGAGGLFALAFTIVADIVPPRDRARYQGLFLAVFGSSSVLGPLIGGLFAGVDQILFIDGWRWVFLMNLPIGLVSLFMVNRFLHIPHVPVPQKIDWWGAVTIIMGVVPILLVAEQGREWGWGSPLAIAMYVIGLIGIVSFILVERKMGASALIPLELFKNKTFALTQLLGFIVGIAMFGGMIVLPLIIQIAYGASPTETGLLMLPMVLGMATATTTTGRFTGKTGKYRIFMNTGTATLFIGYLYMLLLLNAEIEVWVVSIGMVIIGLGLGQLMQTLMVSTQNAVDARNIGVATSSQTFFRQMGGTLGVAVFLSILFSQVSDKIAEAFQDSKVQQGLAEVMADKEALANPANAAILQLMQQGPTGSSAITTDSSFLIGADDRLTLPFRIGFIESSITIFMLASVFVAISFVLSFTIKELALRNKSAAAEAAEAAAAGH